MFMESLIFNRLIDIVTEESGHNRKSILGSNHAAELTDARTIASYFLYFKIGYNTPCIARLMNLSVSGVCYLLQRVESRLHQSFVFRSLMDRIGQRISQEIIDSG